MPDKRAGAAKRLPKSHRLLNAAQYAAVRGRGRRAEGRLFVVIAATNGLGRPRLGIAVSRSVSTRAHDRNRIKRQVREAFRHAQPRLAGLDVLVIARPPAAVADNAALRRALAGAWGRIATKCEN